MTVIRGKRRVKVDDVVVDDWHPATYNSVSGSGEDCEQCGLLGQVAVRTVPCCCLTKFILLF